MSLFTPAPIFHFSQEMERTNGDVLVSQWKDEGKTIAFANGAFDLLHVGHIRYLNEAAASADKLIVAVNSDSSVKISKGESRPVIPQNERAEMVAALGFVDMVAIFDTKTPMILLVQWEPNFQCKGTDYTADTVPEKDIVTAYGGKVLITGDPKNHSTSELVDKLDKQK